MSCNSKVNNFIIDFEESIYNNNAAVFCGAGTSFPSGFVGWKELLRPAATKMSLDIEKETDLIELSQYFVNEHRNNKHPLLELLYKQFTQSNKDNDLLKQLVNLPIHNYWTTNYDEEIEKYLKDNGRNPLVIRNNIDFNRDYSNFTDRVFKFHGDLNDISNCVITRDDYKNFPRTHQMFINALTGQLTEKTFVFLGYSFQDPDFNDLIATLSVIMDGNVRQHYYIDKKIDWSNQENELNDFKLSPSIRNEKEIEINKLKYMQIKQELAIEDRLRFGIQTILIDEFDQIPLILEKIRVRNLTRKIFVAGSKRKEPEGWNERLSYDFLNNLGRELIKQKFHISTGLITGLEPLVAGVLEQINIDNLSSDKYLKIQQLPRINHSVEHMDKLSKKRYQNDMIKNVGIVLFLYGNQTYDDGKTFEPAKGVLSEFKRVKELGNFVIPVPQTGGASEVIFKEIKDNLSNYLYLKDYINKVESIDINEHSLVSLLVETIQSIHNEQSTF